MARSPSISPGDIDVTIEQVAGSNEVTLVNFYESYKYENGRRTDELLGYRNEVVAHKNKFKQFVIKTNKPVVSPEQLAAAEGGAITVRVIGFHGRFFRPRDEKDYIFVATAEDLEILPD